MDKGFRNFKKLSEEQMRNEIYFLNVWLKTRPRLS